MADSTKYTILDDNGVLTLAEEIFKLIKRDYATSDAMNEALAELEAKLNSTDVLISLNPHINENGELIINYPEGEDAPALSINDAGYLILSDSGSDTDVKIAKMSFEINDTGYLVVTA